MLRSVVCHLSLYGQRLRNELEGIRPEGPYRRLGKGAVKSCEEILQHAERSLLHMVRSDNYEAGYGPRSWRYML